MVRRVTAIIAAGFLYMCSASGQGSPGTMESGTRSFDADWRFLQRDTADAEKPAFDDATWQRVELPHDWAIRGPFDKEAPAGGAQAFLPTGVAWYRKHFRIDPALSQQHVFVEFDGAMANSGVWINGIHVNHRPNGYIGFRVELTPHIKFGSDNVIAVRTDTSAQPASRWYAGSGLYRHARLLTTGDVYFDHWATFVWTPTIANDTATVRVSSEILNRNAARKGHLEITLLDPKHHAVAQMRSDSVELAANRPTPVTAETTVRQIQRWDISNPQRYTAIVRVVTDDGVQDEEQIAFGIREYKFDANTGFWLNGRNIKIKGVAIHEDAGAFGMATPTSVIERRLRSLQALGVNAIRTAHNPFSDQFYELCDRLGLLVLDEPFDMWTVGKNPQDYHLYFTDWSLIDARDFIRRDRNHPSVILWSIGNEIHDTQYPIVAKSIIERLKRVFHENDPSREITMALFRPNTTRDYENGLADLLDIVGQNYRENELIAAHEAKPARRILGTENSKTRTSWLAVRDTPAFSGMFLWTGIDYLGEAQGAGWPAISRPTGLLDRIGNPHLSGLERDSWWSEQPVVHIARRLIEPVDTSDLPAMTNVAMPVPTGPEAFADWSPANSSPHPETVIAYSNADEVELLLNGVSQGKKPLNADASPRVWRLTYAPGTLQAIAYNDGKRVAQEMLRTPAKPYKIRLINEQKTLRSGFDEVGFVRVEVVDKNGTVVTDADSTLQVTVSGAGTLAAFDNGALEDHTPFESSSRRALEGKALIMVRATDKRGPIRIQVTSPDLPSASVSIQSEG
jgi:beta-galactosidase